MKVSKTFSIESEDLVKFEAWMNLNKIKNASNAFRLLLKTAGVIDDQS